MVEGSDMNIWSKQVLCVGLSGMFPEVSKPLGALPVKAERTTQDIIIPQLVHNEVKMQICNLQVLDYEDAVQYEKCNKKGNQYEEERTRFMFHF